MLEERRFPRFSLCTYYVTIILGAGDARFFANVIPMKGIETDSNLASVLWNSLKFICSHYTLTGWHLIYFKVDGYLIEFNRIDLLLFLVWFPFRPFEKELKCIHSITETDMEFNRKEMSTNVWL